MRDNVNHETSFAVMTQCDLSGGMPTPLGDRIKQARANARLTQGAMGDLVSVGQTTVQGWESGRNEPTVEKLHQLADKLKIRREWLVSGVGNPDLIVKDVDKTRNDVDMRHPQEFTMLRGRPAPLEKDKDLPIRGHVEGGEEAHFIDNGDPMGFTYRPFALRDVAEAYAVEIHGDSMSPALKPGQVAYVHPKRAVKVGDEVVIQLKDGQALVKELVRRTEHQVIVRQWNPAKEFKIDRKKIESIHLILFSDRTR